MNYYLLNAVYFTDNLSERDKVKLGGGGLWRWQSLENDVF